MANKILITKHGHLVHALHYSGGNYKLEATIVAHKEFLVGFKTDLDDLVVLVRSYFVVDLSFRFIKQVL